MAYHYYPEKTGKIQQGLSNLIEIFAMALLFMVIAVPTLIIFGVVSVNIISKIVAFFM